MGPFSQKLLEKQSTIAALASPQGEGGVGIIRISGSEAPYLLKKTFQGGPVSLSDWQSHHLYLGKLMDQRGAFLDSCLAVWMKAPHSFTGEEVVEFHIHGGPLIAQKVLEEIYSLGFLPAEPGEFSLRAFLNGKMDLTQAEAIADMIQAQSDLSLKLAQDQWAGSLSKPVSELRQKLLEALVHLEAAIDFPEEDIEILEVSKIKQELETTLSQLKSWLKDYELGRILREGLTLALVGKPNVGKSSLLNYLVKEDAAIVHDQPGTTRDVIERKIVLGGLAIRLLDTAGIRKTKETVENKGIEKSIAWLEKADLILALFDSSEPLTQDDRDLSSLLTSRKALFLFTKSDLPEKWDTNDLLSKREAPFLKISTKTGAGMADLERQIPSMFGLQEINKPGHFFVNQLRHKLALEKSIDCLSQALEAMKQKLGVELIATDVMRAAQSIGEIIGEISNDHILADIFSRFCIGK